MLSAIKNMKSNTKFIIFIIAILIFNYLFIPIIRYRNNLSYTGIYNKLSELPDEYEYEEEIGMLYDYLFYLPESKERSEAISAFEDIFIAFGKYQRTVSEVIADLDDRFYKEYEESRERDGY